MAAGREKSASISVSVRPELDRGSFAKTMTDLAAINKQYKNIDKAFSAMSKTSLKNIKEINDILVEAQNLVAGANKIVDRGERNRVLDQAIEMLMKSQGVILE